MSQLRPYQTICVLQPDLQSAQIKIIEDKITKIFSAHETADFNKKEWGIRKLAYPIKKSKTGQYVEYNYKATPGLIADLEKNLGYEETVLRYLTIKVTKRTQEDVQVEPDGFDLYE